MKKNLLTLGLITLGVSASAQVLTYVGPGATMTITSNALVYSGGGWQNANSNATVATPGVVNNFGDVMVVSPAAATNTVFTVADNSFNLKFDDTAPIATATYGQLYINGVSQNNITGKVIKEFKAAATSATTGRQQVALPFVGLTLADLQAATGVTFNTNTALTATGRFNTRSLFKWNNVTARFDQITNSTVLKPTDYVIVPRVSGTSIVWNVDGPDNTVIKGMPVADKTSATNAFALDVVPTNMDFGPNKGLKDNGYKEWYSSYLHDPFVNASDPAEWRSTGSYGKRLSQFANPFLTNLDLSNIGNRISGDTDGVNLSNVSGIAYYNSNALKWTSTAGASYLAGNTTVVTLTNGVPVAGDVDKLLIKPMQEVMIKFNNDTPTTINLDNLRSFNNVGRTNPNYGVSARKAKSSSNDVARQVAVVLLSEQGTEIGRTYYVVAPYTESGYQGGKSRLQASSVSSLIFTKEELSSGGEDATVLNNLYINEANDFNFKGKEIPLVVNFPESSTLKFELYENGVRLDQGTSLTNGVDFYIKNNNNVTRIKDSDIIANSESSYGLFYGQPEGTLSSSESIKNSTIVAKKDTEWVVRFANSWKNAKVEIYSATGQLIHLKENVNTVNDYVLPINSTVNGIFIIKTTSDKGEVVVKKVTK